MRRTIAVQLLIYATGAAGQADQDAWLQEWKNQALREWVFDARVCMRQGIEAQLSYGNRDVEKITAYILPPCGGHIKRVMDSNGANGDVFVRHLAAEEIRRFPVLSPSPKKRPRGREE